MEIVTDVTTDLPEKYKKNVKFIPMYIIKENEKIKVDENFDSKSFYEKHWNELYKFRTSQPSLKDVIEALKNVDEGIVITISKKLSGTYNVIKNACKILKKNIYVYDSGLASIGTGLLIMKLIDRLKRETLNLNEILEFLNKIKIRVLFISQDINFLFKSGRINILKYAFLKLVKKKPLLKLERYKEIEFVKLIDDEKVLNDYKKGNYLFGADLFNLNKVPEPKVLVSPLIIINIGPAIGIAYEIGDSSSY